MMKIIVSLALFYYVQVFNLEGFEYSFENWTVRRIKKNEEFQGFEASVGGKKLRLDWDWIEDWNMMISWLN